MSKISKDQNREALTYKDLENHTSFSKWVKEKLKAFYQDTEVPSSHLKIFLNNYIHKQVENTPDARIDRAKWLIRIRKILERIDILDEDKKSREAANEKK